MSFYQNVFNQEFKGNWVLSDRQYSLTFTCPANRNSSEYQYAYTNGPWDLTNGKDHLLLNYAWDVDFKNYAVLDVDLLPAGALAPALDTAVTAYEVVAILNANATFSDMFVAETSVDRSNPSLITVIIKSKTGRAKKDIKLWISNSGSERSMKFNKYAGVAELPTYFDRHTISSRFSFSDSAGALILLDNTDGAEDEDVITLAGFDPANPLEDWALLRGRASGLFSFKKQTVDGASRITEIIEYPAGAAAGDFARKTLMTYTGDQTAPDEILQIPYVLADGDLIEP